MAKMKSSASTFRGFKSLGVTAGINIKVDLSPLGELSKEFQDGNRGHRELMLTLAYRYRQFAFKRYNKMSKGGWTPIKPRSGKRKREKKRGRKAILIDSLAIRDTLQPGTKDSKTPPPGGVVKSVKDGVIVGIGGGAKHPYANMTIEALALIHQRGKGRVPRREIIVKPDKRTVQLMLNDTNRLINKVKRNKGMT